MGTTTAITNTAGTVAERYSYSAFGQSQVMTASFTNRSLSLYDWQTRFHGETRDDKTGFYNYGYRYYDPVTGRWPSRDPLADEVFLKNYLSHHLDPKARAKERLDIQLNQWHQLYTFVHNDGVNSYDYLGLKDRGWGRRGSLSNDSKHDVLVVDMDNKKCEVVTKGGGKSTAGKDWDFYRKPTGTWHKIGVGELDITDTGYPKSGQFGHRAATPAEAKALDALVKKCCPKHTKTP
jgi:RHS repeat-associated protein